ncbi:MAG TPA: hypothetical protein VMR34_02645 [Candidatus Saccharimonadales bacterium]|nr:hypothetical protein [Candidatus Saccharimonadales bacterium]
MNGTIVAREFDCPPAPDHVVEEGYPINPPIALGRHAVLGGRDESTRLGAAVHSVVGLGEDRPECIEVLTTDGFMGIDSYENVLDFYDDDRSRGLKFFVSA